MSRGKKVKLDRDKVREWVNDYYARNGKRPTYVEAAAHWGCSYGHMTHVMAEIEAGGGLDGKKRGSRDTTKITEERQDAVLRFIVGYIAEHGWAPSRREIEEAVDFTLSEVNMVVAQLAAQGRIEVDAGPRQIRIPGTVIKFPKGVLV